MLFYFLADIILCVLWVLTFALAVTFQVQRERGRPPFPRCPYELRKCHESRELSRSNHAHVSHSQNGLPDDQSSLLGAGDGILGASSGSLCADNMESLAAPGNPPSMWQCFKHRLRKLLPKRQTIRASPTRQMNYGTMEPASPLINDNSNNTIVDPI